MAGANQQIVSHLSRLFTVDDDERLYYLWGATGVGRSHLLQACCQQADQASLSAAYIPLAESRVLSPDVLIDLEQMDLVTLDDIDQIMGDTIWEEAIFHLYNRILMSQTRLIITGNCPPRELAIQLPDLQSRLSACVIYHLQPLTDDEKIQALQLRAKYRGLQLSESVGEYLLKRYPRDMTFLFNLLDELIQASMASQKKLTVALVKSLSL